ncbi:MAG: DNA helicase UvrD [Candidatus Niyogibacteria bacterium]|nr:DNA helicase UvrD [Candidatus Niyogibacteria bacterium]
MKFIADLHIHSKFSRATSKEMCLEELDRWADNKGILVMGTGDFTHPQWFREIKEKLEPAEPGLFRLKKELKRETIKRTRAETRFLLSVEISSIYKKNGKTRRIHNIIFSPDLETAEKINNQLSLRGNIKSDGRPILGLDAEELAKIVFNVNAEAAIIPAHIWTPWFSLFGSMSGFDSLEECFGKMSGKIFAGETGLSSDPAMNWRLSALDNLALISNSDSHSLQRIGREANILNTELSYSGVMEAIKSGAPKKRAENEKAREKFVATVEFFPEEGKYHYDGHRACGIVWPPEETKKHKSICPKCQKPVVVGVLNRTDKLADRKKIPDNQNYYCSFETRVPYYRAVPLDEVIGEAMEVGPASKKVKAKYEELIKKFGNELKILLEIQPEQLEKIGEKKIAEALRRLRLGNIEIRPGYDGEYGVVKIFKEGEKKDFSDQAALF